MDAAGGADAPRKRKRRSSAAAAEQRLGMMHLSDLEVFGVIDEETLARKRPAKASKTRDRSSRGRETRSPSPTRSIEARSSDAAPEAGSDGKRRRRLTKAAALSAAATEASDSEEFLLASAEASEDEGHGRDAQKMPHAVEDSLELFQSIVGHRLEARGDGAAGAKDDGAPRFEYLVKKRNESHRKCVWVPEARLKAVPRAKGRLTKYKRAFQDLGAQLDACNDDPLAGAAVLEIDRVIDCEDVSDDDADERGEVAIPAGEEDGDDRPCTLCKSPRDPLQTMLCDSCDRPFHTYCLTPPLAAVPEGDWFCATCHAIKNLGMDRAAAERLTAPMPAEGIPTNASASSKEAAHDPAAAALALGSPRSSSPLSSSRTPEHDAALEELARIAPPVPSGWARVYRCKFRLLGYAESTWEDLDFEASEEDCLTVLRFWRREAQLACAAEAPIAPSGRQFAPLLTADTIPLLDGVRLRDYQVEGVNWLLNHWELRRGSLLADEMGLGKTLQILGFLSTLRQKRSQPGPFLVVAPLSTLHQWRAEAERFTDLYPVVFHGNEVERNTIKDLELSMWTARAADLATPAPAGGKGKSKGKGKNKTGKATAKKGRKLPKGPASKRHRGAGRLRFDVLITSFEVLLAEKAFMNGFDFSVVVVDEAQRLKNSESALCVALRDAAWFKGAHKVALSGTPIQNSIEELWSLLSFINPADPAFSNRAKFLAAYDPKDAANVQALQGLLRGYLLRRLKGDVEKSLPVKMETIVDVELTFAQKQYYRAILERNRKFLNKGVRAGDQPSLMNVFMQLRKVCNHPYLIKGGRERLNPVPAAKHGATPATTEAKEVDAVLTHPLVATSGKMILLHKLLCKLVGSGEKVLIFSQLTIMLDLIAEYLVLAGFGFTRLDGRVNGQERRRSIARFQAENGVPVFLISTRAGGVGLNLQAASHVVIYDSDWNPQNDLQAQARTHRIGQTREVKIYRLVTRKTYEQHMMRVASLKLGLDAAVLGVAAPDESAAQGPAEPTSKAERTRAIERLLREGSYEILAEDAKTAEQHEKSFAESNIDTLLASSTRDMPVPGSGSNPGKSLFAKATFVASNCDATVELDDPEFWTKLLPDVTKAHQLLAAMSLAAHRLREGFALERTSLERRFQASGPPGQERRPGDLEKAAELAALARREASALGSLVFPEVSLGTPDVWTEEKAQAYPGAADAYAEMLRPVVLSWLKTVDGPSASEAAGATKGEDHGDGAEAQKPTKSEEQAGDAASDTRPLLGPGLAEFVTRVLAEADKAEAVRLRGDPYDDVEAILALLRGMRNCALFRHPALAAMGLARRLPKLYGNIEKPKRRRKPRRSHLGETGDVWEMWDGSGGEKSDGEEAGWSQDRDGDESSAAESVVDVTDWNTEADPASGVAPGGATGVARKKRSASTADYGTDMSAAEICDWAEAVRSKAVNEPEWKSYDAFRHELRQFETLRTDINALFRQRERAAGEDWKFLARESLDRSGNPAAETAKTLSFMIFLDACLSAETKRVVAPRRVNLTIYPPSIHMPIELPYVFHRTVCAKPVDHLNLERNAGGWFVVNSKVACQSHIGAMEGPFGFLAGDVLLGFNGEDVRGLSADAIWKSFTEVNSVELGLVRFVGATNPISWHEVSLMTQSGEAVLDATAYAAQFAASGAVTVN